MHYHRGPSRPYFFMLPYEKYVLALYITILDLYRSALIHTERCGSIHVRPARAADVVTLVTREYNVHEARRGVNDAKHSPITTKPSVLIRRALRAHTTACAPAHLCRVHTQVHDDGTRISVSDRSPSVYLPSSTPHAPVSPLSVPACTFTRCHSLL